jgi:hypothetical protein
MAGVLRLVLVGAVIGLAAGASRADTSAWNGEESPARGKGWTQPATTRIQATSDGPHAGRHCLRIDLSGNGWKGAGWNWFGWYPPDAATSAAEADTLVFWLKASRTDAKIQCRLVDNQKGASPLIDLNAKAALKVLPANWAEIRVPLAAFDSKFDLSRLWEIHFATETPGELTLWVDDIAFTSASSKPTTNAQPANSYSVRVTVTPDKVLHPISPYIYGVSAVDAVKAKQFGVSMIRWGGNRSSRYNWKAQSDNAGSDWFFLNGKAGRWSDFIRENRKNGRGSYLTLPMLPWVAKGPDGWGFSVAKYGPQRKFEQYVADRGDGVRPDGAPITGNDPRDTSVPSTPELQAEGVRALPQGKNGPAVVYALDNEPMLWNHTHRDVHAEPPTYDEVFTRGREFALASKQADPRGLVAGPCTWGWTDLTFSAADAGKDNYATHADNKAHGGVPFLAWYLAAMKAASDKAGHRLLDVVDVHFYPQGQADGQGIYGGSSKSPAMRALRLRSTRALWDPQYRDESWIHEPVMLIPRVRKWVEANNPGTKLAIGEYNWGGDDDASGAVAQAEILGIFARERVDYAFLWAGLDGVQRFAFQLYGNADGRGGGFGDQFLDCRSEAPDRLSVFAARRRDGSATVVLVNKDVDRSAKVQLELSSRAKLAPTIFRLPNPPGPIQKEVVKAGESSRVTLSPLSAALVEFH